MALNKDTWRSRWIGSIDELTSIKTQRNNWLNRENTNPHWSYIEFICCYFDDILLGFDYQYFMKKNWISKKEYKIIKDWHNKLESYKPPKGDDYDNESILSDQKWLDILELGNDAKQKLTESFND